MRQLPGEGNQDQLLDPKGLEQMQLFIREIEAQSRLSVQNLPGVGPETHHGGMATCRVRGDRLDHTPVSGMEPIEAAQGKRCGRAGLLRGAEGDQRAVHRAVVDGKFGRQTIKPAWPTGSISSC